MRDLTAILATAAIIAGAVLLLGNPGLQPRALALIAGGVITRALLHATTRRVIVAHLEEHHHAYTPERVDPARMVQRRDRGIPRKW
jgi:hypothetical protein